MEEYSLHNYPYIPNDSPTSCSICGSFEVEYRKIEKNELELNQPEILKIKLCLACGHAVRVEDRDLKTNLSIQQDIFDKTLMMPKMSHTRWPRRKALIALEIDRITQKTRGNALDIGCNTGLWLASLDKGWKKYGVELSVGAAEIARRFAKAEVYCGPIESFHADLGSFDLITAFALIEHISDPRGMIKWAYEHLKPGGLLVLMTGDRESWTAQQMGYNWPLYWPVEHVSFFSARSLCKLVEDCGFQVVRKEWRLLYTISGRISPLSRIIIKAREILRMLDRPIDDLFYCYAKKIGDS